MAKMEDLRFDSKNNISNFSFLSRLKYGSSHETLNFRSVPGNLASMTTISDMMLSSSYTFDSNPEISVIDVQPVVRTLPIPSNLQGIVAAPIPGVPPGLEVLHEAEFLFIRKTKEKAEFLGDAPCKYEVLDKLGTRLYFAAEMTPFWTRNCCAACAEFKLKIFNIRGLELFYIDGHPSCCECDAAVEVFNGTQLLGSATQNCTCCTPTYDIQNSTEQSILTIKGPANASCSEPQLEHCDFGIFLKDGVTSVGRISKRWNSRTGSARQKRIVKAHNFGISFPVELDAKLKAVLLGTTFMLHFQYFETKGSNRRWLWCIFSILGLVLLAFIAVIVLVGFRKFLPPILQK